MQIISQTLLIIVSIISYAVSKSLQSLEDLSSPIMAPPLDHMMEELEQLKATMRKRAPTLNSVSQLNVTLEAKRKLLKQYREKLQELNELDTDRHEVIHKRDLYTYSAVQGESQVGKYKFPVNIQQPSDHQKETKVQSAALKLYRNPLSNISHLLTDDKTSSKRNIGHNVVLLVYQTLPDSMRRLVTSSVISLAQTGPISIDITEIAQNWVDEPAMNYGIEIDCQSHNISHILAPNQLRLDNQHKNSLDIYTYERNINTVRRQRRSADQEICEPGKCCRHAVNITLADVGHHIDGIHEEGEYITAYLCSGRCPRNYKIHNEWSNIKNIIRSNNRRSQLRNRCAPTEYEKSFFLLSTHPVDGTMAIVEYDDLIVKQCGCV